MTSKRYSYYLLDNGAPYGGVTMRQTVRTANAMLLVAELQYLATHRIIADYMERIYDRNWVSVIIR